MKSSRIFTFAFLAIITKQLVTTISLPSSFSEYFRRIRILDATTFQISDQLAAVYPGSGGSGKASGVKIQLEYDLLSGQFYMLHWDLRKKMM